MHRILVVDDDPALRRILSMLFETNGFRVVAADTCELIDPANPHYIVTESGIGYRLSTETYTPETFPA
jgi:DNA-binding response OmpR family regulator